ncbi:hypothetical protein ACA910_020688 [Epithemia clementina (nom. ined.)]
MIRSADLAEYRPSVVDAMQACEKNSSAKDDSAHNMRLLPEGYRPGEHDVLCGRGRKCFNHSGNVKFRAIVQSFLPQYSKAVAKLEKSYILSDVVEQVRKNSGVGGFIKKDPDTGRWYEVGDFLAREKTSQAFRDVLHDKYKSSNTAKKKRRQEEQAEKLVRAHSNRSLGANSLDASSVHSVGSSTTGDYMLSDSKLMRMERLERSDSILNLGEAEDEGQHDDLLGGLDQDIANYGRPRTFNRQRSLRAVLDFDTNRRAVMSQAADGGPPSFYNRSSCPNLFAAPQQQRSHNGASGQQHQQQLTHHSGSTHRSHNSGSVTPHNNHGSVPPISHIEIIQEEKIQGHSPMMFPDTLESAQLHDFDSYDTNVPGDGSVASNSSSNAGIASNPGSQQNWFHHSQPNLFGDAPPVNSQAGQRRGYARAPPNRMMRRPMRHNSGGPNSGGGGALLGVEQRIGNLGLNDSNHGTPSFLGLNDSNHGKPSFLGLNDSNHGKPSFLGLNDSNHGKPSYLGLNDSNHGKPSYLGLNDSNHGKPSFDTSGNGPPQGTVQIINGLDVGDDDDEDQEEADRHYLPQGLQHQHQHLLQQQQLLGMNQSHPGEQLNGQGGNNNSNNINNNINTSHHHPVDDDANLLARLQALENTGFGMDVIDENPFEPVPLREG